MTPTSPDPTDEPTPIPPKAANAHDEGEYPGTLLGSIFLGGKIYKLYQGVSAPDGTLALPSTERGAALYRNVLWVHRAWNSGWLNLELDDYVVLMQESTLEYYRVTKSEPLPYDVYPPQEGFYLATCMSSDGKVWTGIELFHLQLMRTRPASR